MSNFMAWIDALPDSVILVTLMVLFLALCGMRNWRLRPASRGLAGELPAGTRPGTIPPNAPVVSGGTHLDTFADAFVTQRPEQAPACDRAIALSETPSEIRVIGVRSTVGAGAPTVLYRWVRPAAAHLMEQDGWKLEFIDARYGQWLMRKEERWQ